MNTFQGLIGAGILITIALGVFALVELNSVKSDISTINKDIASVKEEVKKINLRPAQANRPPQAQAEPQNVKVSIDDDPMKGKADAPVTIVEFSDYQCPFCKRWYDQSMPSLDKEYIDTGKVRLVFRDFPLQFHPKAMPAALAANCAAEQGKYWEMHDFLFGNPDKLEAEMILASSKEIGVDRTKLEKCMNDPGKKAEITKDMEDAQKYGVRGTPSFFIGKTEPDGEITGVSVKGAQPYPVFKKEIDALLTEND